VIDLVNTWEELPDVRIRGGAPYPFQFSREEKAEIEANVNGALRGMEAMSAVQKRLGGLSPERGTVRADQYEEACDALQQVKEQVNEFYARSESDRQVSKEAWPFDDEPGIFYHIRFLLPHPEYWKRKVQAQASNSPSRSMALPLMMTPASDSPPS